MASFEQAVQASIDSLRDDCPLRNHSARIEMARLDVEATGNDEGAVTSLAVIEADAASDIVFASVFKQRHGCAGAEPLDDHGTVCECGNTTSCPAYNTAAYIISAETED